MDTSTPEYKRVREEIARTLYILHPVDRAYNIHEKWETLTEDSFKESFRKQADSILSIKGVAILADDQEWEIAFGNDYCETPFEMGCSMTDKQHFKKVV
jgi:hypothetical protein